jgi:hypothetical protein
MLTLRAAQSLGVAEEWQPRQSIIQETKRAEKKKLTRAIQKVQKTRHKAGGMR